MDILINGINVLAKEEITTIYDWNANLFLISIFLIFLSVALSITYKKYENTFVALGAICGVVWVFSIASFGIFEKPTGEYKYKVTIDDDVKFKDVYENYIIHNVDGEIYTIEYKKE